MEKRLGRTDFRMNFLSTTGSHFTRQATGLVWMFCVLICSISVFNLGSQNKDDRVYCPLRNIWVERSRPQPQPGVDLGGICAPAELKDEFIARASLFLRNVENEGLFFDFAADGEWALGDLPSLPRGPTDKLSPIDRLASTSVASDKDPAVRDAELGLEYLALSAPTNTFLHAAFGRLDIDPPFSPNTPPRAPPIISL